MAGVCTCEFVEFECECYGKEEELVGDRYYGGDAQVVVIKDVYDGHAWLMGSASSGSKSVKSLEN